MSYGWSPYVSVAERRAKAAREMSKLAKKGHAVSPVVIEGRTIARTFWGQAWCTNLEGYSDFANRLPRGRTYVRNGSVVDLQIGPGAITARVAGSELYTVRIQVKPLPKAHWKALCGDCAGAIASLVELLQGRFSKGVMERLCRQDGGLFPSPSEITLDCSCPDWAGMCKHVAAVLYGIGARLDDQPELLFVLRQVDGGELVAQAASGLPLAKKGPSQEKVLAEADLSDLFGLDMVEAPPASSPVKPRGADKASPAKGSGLPSRPAKATKASKAAPQTPKAPRGPKAAPPVPSSKETKATVLKPAKAASPGKARTPKPVKSQSGKGTIH